MNISKISRKKVRKGLNWLGRGPFLFSPCIHINSHKWYAILQLQFVSMFYLLRVITGTIISYGFAKDHFDVVHFFFFG